MAKEPSSSRSDLPTNKSQVEQHRSPEAQQNLTPEQLARQNISPRQATEEPHLRYASEIKELVRLLEGFTLRELQRIPVLVEGTPLQQGQTYLDLQDPAREPFAATAELSTKKGQWLVPQTEVPSQYWKRLREAVPPKRQR